MKRSEILAILKEETDNWMHPAPTNYELDCILNVLEKAGMIPPPIQKPLQYHQGKQLFVEYHNIWESENE